MPRKHRPKHLRHYHLRQGIKYCLIILLLLLIAYPFVEPWRIQVEQTTITDETFPKDIRRLRAVYVSDLHTSAFPFFSEGRLDSLIKQVNSLNADIVLLGGDYASDLDSAVKLFQSIHDKRISQFHATYGVYAVLGEHDRVPGERSLTDLRSAMMAAGITPLVNHVEPLRIGTSTIYLAGLDDTINGRPDLNALTGQLRQSDYVLFLCHNPGIITTAMSATGADGKRGWFDIGFFGHTHGGQLPMLGEALNLVEPGSRYVGGWVTENRIRMLVSNGIGTSVVPLRLFCPPQLHLLTIMSP